MCRPVCWTWLPLLLLGWLVNAGPALAQARPSHGVVDEAKLFSPEAKSQAEREIDDIKRLYKKDFLILTFPDTEKSPVGKLPEDKSKYRKYFDEWAEREFESRRVDGILVLICKNPTILADPVVGNETRKHLFTARNGQRLGEIMLAKLKAKDPDGALREGVAYVRRTLQENAAVAQKRRPNAQPGGARVDAGKGQQTEINPIWGWICMGIGALLVVWVIFGIIRAFSGGGGGGMGGGGMGGGMGGGGGGFFTGLLGGLFGAMAGSWLYNNFFGGHQSNFSNPSGGGDYGGADADRPDTSGEATGGGGDWGGGDGGGDGGGGGGDWGGGGGDGGGGGGDWGGGGGGDWGGGGGGDFGGGGGGGDW